MSYQLQFNAQIDARATRSHHIVGNKNAQFLGLYRLRYMQLHGMEWQGNVESRKSHVLHNVDRFVVGKCFVRSFYRYAIVRIAFSVCVWI